MNKKTVISFAAFLTGLCMLTACGTKAKTSPYGAVITDDKGMEHIIQTNAAGVTQIDKNGNLIEIMTDSDSKMPIAAPTENGTSVAEYQTNIVTFPALVQDGDKVENRLVSVTLPKGWSSDGALQMILTHTDTGAQITVDPGVDASLAEALDRMDSDRAALNADYDYTQTETTLGGLNAVCEKYAFADVVRSVYLVENEHGTVVQIACTVSADLANSVDFNAVLQNIQFK